MSPAEIGAAVAVVGLGLKVAADFVQLGEMRQKIKSLEADVANDKEGRKVFAEVRTDVAVMKRDIEYIKAALDKRGGG